MVGYGVVDPYWGMMLKRMTLYIPTGDGVVGYGAVYLYWRRCGRLPHCRILLGIEYPVEYSVVHLY